jgi:hypothetical protein
MGMHFGIIAGKLSLDSLTLAFNELGLELRHVKSLDRIEDAPRDADDEETYIIAGERDGACYLIDQSMALSAGHLDLLAAAAKRAGGRVVSCGAETTSGTFWFSAFDGEDLLRMFWMCRMELDAPFSAGIPLQGEASHPLDMDWDGEGIFAALSELGFDYHGWLDVGPYRLLTRGAIPTLANRPLEEARDEHYRQHQLEPDERPEISVVQRAPVSTPSTGPMTEAGRASTPGKLGIWQRIVRAIRRE